MPKKNNQKQSFEVILSNKETGFYFTEHVSSFNLKTAIKKAESQFSEKYLIHDVHEKG
jgi:hypothetical protein